MLLTLPLSLCLSAALPQRESIPATPLIKPQEAQQAEQAIPAVPMMSAGEPAVLADGHSLTEEYQAAYASWRKEVQAMAAQKTKEFDAYPEQPGPSYYPRFSALARQGDFEARLWCLENFTFDPAQGQDRADKWLSEYLSCVLASKDNAAARLRLRQGLFAGSRLPDWHDLDRAAAALERVSLEEERAAVAGLRLALLSMEDNATPELQAHCQALEERLLSTWPDSEAATRLLGKRFAKENLQLGMVAPELAGADVDGNLLSLHAQRGKVVVIDFWGFW
jgi:hypothetical protein